MVSAGVQTEDPEEAEEEEDLGDTPPPQGAPKLKKGMHMPFGIRVAMGEFPNNKRIMQRRVYLQSVLSFFFFKITADRLSDEMVPPRPRNAPCAEVYHFLLQKYGLAKITDWNVTEIVNSTRHFAQDEESPEGCRGRALIFGRLIGAFQVRSEGEKREKRDRSNTQLVCLSCNRCCCMLDSTPRRVSNVGLLFSRSVSLPCLLPPPFSSSPLTLSPPTPV